MRKLGQNNDESLLEHQDIDPNEVEEVAVDFPLEAPKVIVTVKEADKAAKAAGMRLVRASKFKGIATFGQFVEQNGALRTGLGMIAFTAEQLQDSLDKADQLDKEIEDPEVRVNLLGIKRDLTEQYLDTAKALLKCGEKTVTISQPTVAAVPGPPPGMAITVQKGAAVQINSAPNQQKG